MSSTPWPSLPYEAWRANVRHAARAHSGPRQARGRPRAARTAAPARCAPPHRAWLGDAAAPRTRSLRRAGRGTRSPPPSRRSRAQRRSRARVALEPGPTRRRGDARAAESSGRSGRSGAHLHDAAGDTVDDAARRRLRTRHLRSGSRRALLRGSHSGRPGPRHASCAIPGPLDARERLVGHLRSRGQPLLGSVGRPAVERLHHAQLRERRADRDRLVARRRPLPPRRVLRVRVPAPRRASRAATVSPTAAHWDAELGEYILDWDDARSAPDPHAVAVDFGRSIIRHACAVCNWDSTLAASAEGVPPPII